MLEHLNLSILLVDDNKVNQFLSKKILSNLGISRVEVAADGNAALQLILSNHYHAVLTDVEMPGMNGYELTGAIRALKNGKSKIPVIAITANDTPSQRDEALQHGMSDYLAKPYSTEELQGVLEKFFSPEKVQFEEVQVAPKKKKITAQLVKSFNLRNEDIKSYLLALRTGLPEQVEDLKHAILDEKWELAAQHAQGIENSVKLFDQSCLRSTGLISTYVKTGQFSSIPTLYEELHIHMQSLLLVISRELEEMV